METDTLAPPETKPAQIPFKYHKGKGLFGDAMEFLENTAEFCTKYADTKGDWYAIRILMVRKLFISFRPEVLSYVLQKNAKNYQKGLAYNDMKLFLGEGLVTSEGDFWRRQRRIVQPAFTKTNLAKLFDGMAAESERYFQEMKARTTKGETLDMALEMMHVTANIVMTSLFSKTNDRDQEQMYESMEYMQSVVLKHLYHPYLKPWYYVDGTMKKFNGMKKELDDMMYGWIEERRKMTERPADLLTMLIESTDSETGEGMSDLQLRDEIATLYIAGHETSANALAWTIYELSQKPEIIAKLREEEERVLNGRTPNFQDIMQLTYTKQVLDEGMRLYPPAYVISRLAIEDDIVEGVKVKKDENIYMSIYALHRNPAYWENPTEFNPDRFTPEEVKKRPKMTYMPFGAGARMCIGNHFAMMEMQMILIMFVRNFNFDLTAGFKAEMQPLITLKPKDGIMMEVSPKQPQL